MSSPLTLTPCRILDFDADVVTCLMTPEVKKDFRCLFDDEDSGLGMDDGAVSPERHTSTELSPFNLKTILNLTDFSNEKVKKSPHQKRTEFTRSLFSCKRQREEDDEDSVPSSKSQRRGDAVFRRSLSFENMSKTSFKTRVIDVKAAVNRFVDEEDLIGDGTNTCCLPTVRGKHQDLKSISSNTMVDILTGAYDDVVGSYRIIDCRYPYEFQGGHIKHAENKYTRDQVQQLLHEIQSCDVIGKRNILIFHCEFSSERGPKMMRFLRTQDRAQNEANYPALTYPEVYLLDGGYKAFYNTEHTLCQPMEYKPMLHQGHSDELRHFRARSRSWTAGEKQKKTVSRLRF
ncbi:cdc25-like protein phosphatase twine [Ylistrum balloti]|uniref:cdc25-like protein phosphatase twine n=1 Tax=Ylistrum balloti TaxID=509963 RepID=UPI0029059816|nr:cdc25-like protein phosphatase twine [Ylistrum balloti]